MFLAGLYLRDDFSGSLRLEGTYLLGLSLGRAVRTAKLLDGGMVGGPSLYTHLWS